VVVPLQFRVRQIGGAPRACRAPHPQRPYIVRVAFSCIYIHLARRPRRRDCGVRQNAPCPLCRSCPAAQSSRIDLICATGARLIFRATCHCTPHRDHLSMQ
jgi:hypothetical protein